MFLLVNVPDKDRNALRLTGWAENDTDEPVVEHKVTSHPFVTVSNFCTNYTLRKIAAVVDGDISNFCADD